MKLKNLTFWRVKHQSMICKNPKSVDGVQEGNDVSRDLMAGFEKAPHSGGSWVQYVYWVQLHCLTRFLEGLSALIIIGKLNIN